MGVNLIQYALFLPTLISRTSKKIIRSLIFIFLPGKLFSIFFFLPLLILYFLQVYNPQHCSGPEMSENAADSSNEKKENVYSLSQGNDSHDPEKKW